MVIYFEVSNTKFSSDEPNKDKLLVDLVSYVLDKLHYDPKIINAKKTIAEPGSG